MASNYGANFGFRRSDESLLVREGRFRVPASGTYRMGTLVAINAAAPGFLRAANALEIGEGGTVGLLVQEEAHINSIYSAEMVDTYSSRMGVAKNNSLAVITSGAGGKVWLKNTAGLTQADGRVIAAVTMVDLTGVAVLDYLKWTGTQFAKSAAATVPLQLAESMLRVTAVDSAAGLVEAVLVR